MVVPTIPGSNRSAERQLCRPAHASLSPRRTSPSGSQRLCGGHRIMRECRRRPDGRARQFAGGARCKAGPVLTAVTLIEALGGGWKASQLPSRERAKQLAQPNLMRCRRRWSGRHRDRGDLFPACVRTGKACPLDRAMRENGGSSHGTELASGSVHGEWRCGGLGRRHLCITECLERKAPAFRDARPLLRGQAEIVLAIIRLTGEMAAQGGSCSEKPATTPG